MKYKHYTLESPEVIAILQDVWKSSKGSYYRISPDGRHSACTVRQELVALGICPTIASRLLRDAVLPTARFIHNRTGTKLAPIIPEALITTVDASVEVHQQCEEQEIQSSEPMSTMVDIEATSEVQSPVSETVAAEEVVLEAPRLKEKKKEPKPLTDQADS